MGQPVVNNAQMSCTMGAAPSVLGVLPTSKVTIDGPSMEGEGVLTVETSNGPVRVSHGG